MCLSSVYLLKAQKEKKLLCKNIASVATDGGRLIFTDILGIPTTIEGKIIHIDLVENTIEVTC